MRKDLEYEERAQTKSMSVMRFLGAEVMEQMLKEQLSKGQAWQCYEVRKTWAWPGAS